MGLAGEAGERRLSLFVVLRFIMVWVRVSGPIIPFGGGVGSLLGCLKRTFDAGRGHD